VWSMCVGVEVGGGVEGEVAPGRCGARLRGARRRLKRDAVVWSGVPRTTQAFDLLGRLLRYDHHERLTCAEAMAHPYFDAVR
jgi:hypothetical protein